MFVQCTKREVKMAKNKLVEDVILDYISRRDARRSLESQWRLNINFMMGNQYSFITSNGAIKEDERQYFWQEKEVFNHIAPIIETRISKISNNTPSINVIPATNDEADKQSAELSKEILKSVTSRLNLYDLIKNATTWCETCGSVFYKIVWDTTSGKMVAKDESGASINEGDVSVEVVSPFEIFPDNLACDKIEELKSLIHARAVDIDEIKHTWGVDVDAEQLDSFSLDNMSGNLGGLGYNAHINRATSVNLNHHCLLIERYVRPTKSHPEGRLTIVAGGKLLFDGELPYFNGETSNRTFPFVKQIANYMPGSFFGVSVVDRLIPIQRAYNAVRNRKHEYFNRSVLNVLAVEDGSVDTDALEVEGLSPGKVLVYRQGSKSPEIMQNPKMTIDFDEEENRLLSEFKTVSGVSDMMSDHVAQFANMSGVALELLAEQDNERLSTSINSCREAIKQIAKHILRLYKQFAIIPRLIKIAGESGEIKSYYWDNNEICSDDVEFDASVTNGDTLAQRRSMLLEIIKQGVLYDENGKLSQTTRKKCLDLLGFGSWENTTDLATLHINHAKSENLKMASGGDSQVMSIDDHNAHILEHTAYVLSGEFDDKKNREIIISKIISHIDEHKKYLKNEEI